MSMLAGRTALVTGASRGIGRAIAVAYAAAGARVALGGRDVAALEETGAKCPGAVVVPFDVGSEQACVAAVARVHDELGGLDLLVNNAGIAESVKFTDCTLDQWRRIMAIDVEGPMLLIRAALPGMLAAGRGSVVSIASVAARLGLPYVAAYTAAKHALLGLTRSLSAEYARSGVTFNCICPFYADTPMTERTVANIVTKTGRPPEEAMVPLLTPQGRLIDVDEVAAMAVLLASDAGRSITGQAIHIDGGRVQA